MERRTFLARLVQLTGLAALPAIATPTKTAALLLQTSPIAGFQYHQGVACWTALDLGTSLQLVREPDNRHDPRAIRIDWQGRKLGYIPQVENTTLASLMDRGHVLTACIADKQMRRDPWQRLKVAVYLTSEGRT